MEPRELGSGPGRPELPAWPAPTTSVLSGREAGESFVRSLRSWPDRALGVYVAPDPRPHLDLDDPRAGDPWAVAIARQRGSVAQAAPSAFVLCGAGLDALPEVLEWLADRQAPYLVFHGAQAALGRLRRWGARSWQPPRLGCTQTAAILLAEGQRRPGDLALGTCVERVLRHRVAPPQRLPGADYEGLLQCAVAADTLPPLAQAMVPMLRKRNLLASFTLECELVPAVVAMEQRGMPVDAAAFERVADDWRAERAHTDEQARIARLDKLIGTYAHWPRDYARAGRIFCRLHPLATDSGRFSCTDPNLQQVPSETTAPGLRGCFRAPAGSCLVMADYAQIELRVAAHLAPCRALAEVFIAGRDPHRATAATLTGKPEGSISDHERKLAKAVNFGFLFGMGVERFRDYARDGYGVELDEVQARRAREAFFATFPGIAAWHRRVAQLCRAHESIVVSTALGRRKRFARGRVSVPAALNIPVQGTAAEGFKRAITALEAELPPLGAHGVLCVHDEYLAEAPVAGAELVRQRMAAVMIEAMGTVVTTVPIAVECRVAPAWGPASG